MSTAWRIRRQTLHVTSTDKCALVGWIHSNSKAEVQGKEAFADTKQHFLYSIEGTAVCALRLCGPRSETGTTVPKQVRQ